MLGTKGPDMKNLGSGPGTWGWLSASPHARPVTSGRFLALSLPRILTCRMEAVTLAAFVGWFRGSPWAVPGKQGELWRVGYPSCPETGWGWRVEEQSCPCCPHKHSQSPLSATGHVLDPLPWRLGQHQSVKQPSLHSNSGRVVQWGCGGHG